MSHHDDAVDSVLNALGTAEPAAGFEARIHHALRRQEAPRHAWRMPWMWVAAACCVLCGIAVMIGVRPNYRRNTLTSVTPLPAPSHSIAPTLVQEVPVRERVERRPRAKLVRVAAPQQPDTDVATTHQNMPPPPLPLTQEERLVIRMMRHNDLPQLAALSTEARARSLHDDAEEYRTFFAPRPPLKGQPYYDQHIYDHHTSGEAQ